VRGGPQAGTASRGGARPGPAGELEGGSHRATQEARRHARAHRQIAKRFGRSDGPWNEIQRRLQSSADRVRSHWKDKYGAAKSACTNLSLGEDHPDAKTAINEMQRDTSAAGATYRELRAEYNRWDAEVDKLRDWSKQDVEEIRQAFCRAPDAGEYEEVYAVADRWAVQLNDQWGSINGQGNRIKARTQELINKGRAPKNGPKVIAAVDTILTSIAKIKEYQLKGSNNPLLKARAEFGVDEHNQRQRGCQAKEVLISSSYCDNPHPKRKDCKIDCVKVSSKTCTIIEIKPKDAERLGRNQVAAYALAISKMFAQRGTSEFTDRLGVFRECVSEDGKTLALERAVELYDFCPSTSQLGETPAEVNITIPEEEE
jgi:hypothetical protein